MDKSTIRIDLIKVQTEINRIPTKILYENLGKHSVITIIKYFGSWSNALKEVFGLEPKIKKRKHFSQCLVCGTMTKNPKFCSCSCSNSFNGSIENGRSIGRKTVGNACHICKTWIHSNVRRCKKCKPLIKSASGSFVHSSEITKLELLTNDTQKYRRIRSHARMIATQHQLLDKCYVCKYDTYVECAHITPIASFSDDCLLCKINEPENLIGLCPNHHWEYDHGLLVLT